MPFNTIFSPPLYKRTVIFISFIQLESLLYLKTTEHDFAKNEPSYHYFVQNLSGTYRIIRMYVHTLCFKAWTDRSSPASRDTFLQHIVFLLGLPAAFAVCPAVLPALCSVAYRPLQAPVCFSEGCLLPVSELWHHLEAWNTLSHPL